MGGDNGYSGPSRRSISADGRVSSKIGVGGAFSDGMCLAGLGKAGMLNIDEVALSLTDACLGGVVELKPESLSWW